MLLALLQLVDRRVDPTEPRLRQAQLAREERDLAGELVRAAVARRDVADERDDERVQEQVGAAADVEQVGQVGEPLREQDGEPGDDHEAHQEQAPDGLVPGVDRGAREQDRDHGDGHDEDDLDEHVPLPTT
ncbi:Uncharacterised protein [Mycobacteroides abscessus]|nr:Uncharacterised protein [Mycobacteroides abscessus]